MMRDGRRMQVIRPASPEMALQLVQKLMQSQDSETFANLPAEVGCDYTFVGWASKDGQLLDDEDNAIGPFQRGDSFVTGFSAAIGGVVIHGTPEGAPN